MKDINYEEEIKRIRRNLYYLNEILRYTKKEIMNQKKELTKINQEYTLVRKKKR